MPLSLLFAAPRVSNANKPRMPKRVCGPLAHSLFHHRDDETLTLASKAETAGYEADHAIQRIVELLAA